MSTPCIVASGTQTAWRGVPCKRDGVEERTGVGILDQVVRSGGVAAAARSLVDDAPFGWERVGWGGGRLTERDDFLDGGGLSETTPPSVLANHYALFLLDAEANKLHVKVLPEDRWLAPVELERDGALVDLPAWYPKPSPEHTTERLKMPASVKASVRTFCEKNRIRQSVLVEALRTWAIAALGDLPPGGWILAGSAAPGSHYVEVRSGDTTIFISRGEPGGADAWFTGSDGRLRLFDIHDVAGAGKRFAELPRLPQYSGTHGSIGLPRPDHALQILEILASAAYEIGAAVPTGRASFMRDKWYFLRPGSGAYAGARVADHLAEGWLAPLLSWLLSA